MMKTKKYDHEMYQTDTHFVRTKRKGVIRISDLTELEAKDEICLLMDTIEQLINQLNRMEGTIHKAGFLTGMR